jgi:carboxylesterase
MNKIEKINGYRGSHVIPGGPTGVLLIHSLGGNPAELRFVAQGLARAGHTVYCPLLPGFGAGTDSSGLSSWKDWYTALEAAHDELKSRCDVIVVGGISAGSILALRLARERPADVHGLLLFSPTIWPNGWAIPKSFHLFRLVMCKWFARLFHFRLRSPFGIKDERIRNVVVGSFKSDDCRFGGLFGWGGGLVFEFKALARDVKRRLALISQPTHIFHPRDDDQSDLTNAVAIARGLGGPVELTVLDDSYHLVTLDRQRSVVVERTVDFACRLMQSIEERAHLVRLANNKAIVEKRLLL